MRLSRVYVRRPFLLSYVYSLGFVLLLLLPHISVTQVLDVKPNTTKLKSKCDLCKGISTKFQEGLKSTAKSNFGGGNTKWEEKSLGQYKYSETRLIEIMDILCEKSNQECHLLVEENENYLEYYWENVFTKEQADDFHQWFCVNNVKVCCDNGTYGAHCTPCPGGSTQPCSGNGDCQGDGTRDGTGVCSCHAGYMGDVCNDCHTNYYAVISPTTKTVCTACDVSCKDSCTDAGPGGCDDCKAGYVEDDTLGCVDVNECDADAVCDVGTFCLNNAGSYECKRCDVACASCTAGGPTSCLACAHGYRLDDLSCTDINECLDGTLCQGEHEKCENTAGGHYCGCDDGYIRSNDVCIPKPLEQSETVEDETTQPEPSPESRDSVDAGVRTEL